MAGLIFDFVRKNFKNLDSYICELYLINKNPISEQLKILDIISNSANKTHHRKLAQIFQHPLLYLSLHSACFSNIKNLHNDQCVFYECLTCGITDKKLVCAECALYCHAGHELVIQEKVHLYNCTCVEHFHCKSCYSIDKNSRFELIVKLMDIVILFTRVAK